MRIANVHLLSSPRFAALAKPTSLHVVPPPHHFNMSAAFRLFCALRHSHYFLPLERLRKKLSFILGVVVVVVLVVVGVVLLSVVPSSPPVFLPFAVVVVVVVGEPSPLSPLTGSSSSGKSCALPAEGGTNSWLLVEDVVLLLLLLLLPLLPSSTSADTFSFSSPPRSSGLDDNVGTGSVPTDGVEAADDSISEQ